MELKWTVTIGQVIEIVTLAVGLVAAYVKFSNRFTKVETRVSIMYHWWEKEVDQRGASNDSEESGWVNGKYRRSKD